MTLSLWPTDEETIEGAGRDLREGRITCVGLVERCLAKIEEWEPKVKAWVVVAAESALTEARGLDALLAQGTDLGPLHGIPIGIKDIIDVRGLETRAGVQRWSRGPAEADARVVCTLRADGAIILGKTVTTPYAFLDPPPTRNPWNLNRTPGGSSSGSAAAVATGMCLAAIGTQTVGSIIRPASFCGVTGWKPDFQASATLDGIVPLAPTFDRVGILARTVRDLLLTAWPSLRFWHEESRSPVEGYLAPRIAVAGGQFREQADPTMRAAFAKAVAAWADAGAEIVEFELPHDLDELRGAGRTILAAEAAWFHRARFEADPADYPPRIASLIAEGLSLGAVDLVTAQRLLHNYGYRESPWPTDDTVIITPAALGPAPGPETTGDAILNAPWSFLGLPVISLPIGLTPDEMPLGAQVIGLQPARRLTFDVAAWCEDVLKNRLKRERA